MKISSAIAIISMQARIISSTPLSTTSGSAVAPPGTSVTVQNAGSGCSGRGTVPYMVDPTFTALNLTTPNLIVSNSGNSGPRVARKNCAITLGFNYPAGWQYAVQNGGWSGTANVPAGVTGLSAGHYYFAGESNQVDFDYAIPGPYNARFKTEHTAVGNEVWSPCQRSSVLIFNVEARLQSSSGKGSVSLEKVGVALAWRRC